MTDDTERRRAGKDEMRGRRRHVYGEAEQVDHERHMNHAAADAEDARDEADACARADAERAVECEACRERVDIRMFLVRGVPIHEQCHHKQE